MVKSKKHLFFILCIIILGIIFSFNDISYASYTSEMIFYEIDNNEVTITAGGNSKDVNIPNYIEDYPVTKISYRAFCLNPYYTSITLPETLITIEKEAIISCENIREITIPKNVQNIDSYALGYELNFNYNIEKVEYTYNKMKDFIIKGYKGTVAESYANENGFKFIALDEEPEIPTTEPTEEPTEPIQPTETTETTVLETTTATETTLTEATEVTTETTLTETIAATETTDATSSFAASETTVPVTSTAVESETIDTVSTYITTATMVSTTTSTATLPETGYSKWYHDLIAAAVGMVGVGSAAIIKSGFFRKKEDYR